MARAKDVTSEIDMLFGADAPIVEVNPRARPRVQNIQRKKIGTTLSMPEQKLVEAMLDKDQPTLTEAARRAGMHRNTAARALKKPEVKDAFKRILDEYGLTDARLADKVNQLLEAQTTIFSKGEALEVNDNRVQLETTKVLKDLLGRGPKVGGAEAGSGEHHVHLHLEKAGVSRDMIMLLDRVMRRDKETEPIDVTPVEP